MLYRLIVSGDEEARNVFREACLEKGSIIAAHFPFGALPKNVQSLVGHKYDELFIGMGRHDRELTHLGTTFCVDVYRFDLPSSEYHLNLPECFQSLFKIYEGLLSFYFEYDDPDIWLDQRVDEDDENVD